MQARVSVPTGYAISGAETMRVALTDRFVAGAKSTSSRTEFFDTKAKGLSLRVSERGAKTWSLHFTGADGRRSRVTLGQYPSMGLAAARGVAIETRGIIETGSDPRAHKSGAMTVSAVVDSYLAKHVRPNLRGSRQVERRLRKNVLPLIGDVRLADLHKRDVNRVIDAIVSRDSPIEANCVFADLRGMFRWAMKRGDLDANPVAGMSAPSPPRRRERTLSEAEIRKLWNVLPTALTTSLDAQRILRLCLITAQRVGEVAGIARRAGLDRARMAHPCPAVQEQARAHSSAVQYGLG